MDQKHSELWNRIQKFSFDGEGTRLTFAKRLARENGWSVRFAERAVEEYKKFAYLACVSGQAVTPSDEVDQVWHLHLTYTRSYWDRFCTDVLRKPLHHDPTQGGSDEDKKYERQYEQTLAFYEREFGHRPPSDIWPASDIRFGKAAYMKRVDVSENWLVPKRIFAFPSRLAFLSAGTFTLAGCTVFGFELTQSQVITGILIIVFLVLLIFFLANVKSKGGNGCGGGGSSGCSSGSSGCGSGCGGGGGCGGG